MKTFSFPRIVYYGLGSREMLGEAVSNYGWKRALIVCDRVVEELGMVEDVAGVLRERGVEVKIYDRVEPEPTFEQVEEIGRVAVEFKPDVIVAVGGGSVIDAAKGAWIKCERPEYDLHSVSPFEQIGVGRRCMLVAIPTTSGTGSEVTLGMVLTEHAAEGKRKVALGSLEIVPTIAVLDPDLPRSMPQRLTVSTGVDALAHAVEALACTEATEFTDALAVKAIEMVFRYLPAAVRRPDDGDARSKMHLAAFMAGMAFSNSGLGLAHAVGHALGPVAGLPHGTSVGIALPYTVDYNSRDEGAARKYRMVASMLKATGVTAVSDLYEALLLLYEEVGQPRTVREAGGDYSEVARRLDSIIEGVFQDPDLAFNPVFPTRDEVKEILGKIIG